MVQSCTLLGGCFTGAHVVSTLMQECARLGISGGVNVRAELKATVGQELPQQLAQVLSAVKAQGIADAAE
jgi:uncharacterized membrane protein